MSFFDSKEEVISIELTQYGKEVFSKGLFQPSYYEFYDDDVIYDSSWGGLSEDQNDIESRILEQSIYMKPVYNFSDRMKLNEKYDFFKSEPVNNLKLKNSIPISTNNSINNYTPSWDIKILNGLVETYSTSSDDILQLNLKDLNVYVSGQNLQELKITSEDILIEFEEENCISSNQNFEIEFFEIDETDTDNFNRDKLNKISFGQDPIYIKNGILLDNPVFPKELAENDKNKVEYYFKVTNDKKIDTLILKDIKEKSRKIYNSAIAGE